MHLNFFDPDFVLDRFGFVLIQCRTLLRVRVAGNIHSISGCVSGCREGHLRLRGVTLDGDGQLMATLRGAAVENIRRVPFVDRNLKP